MICTWPIVKKELFYRGDKKCLFGLSWSQRPFSHGWYSNGVLERFELEVNLRCTSQNIIMSGDCFVPVNDFVRLSAIAVNFY